MEELGSQIPMTPSRSTVPTDMPAFALPIRDAPQHHGRRRDTLVAAQRFIELRPARCSRSRPTQKLGLYKTALDHCILSLSGTDQTSLLLSTRFPQLSIMQLHAFFALALSAATLSLSSPVDTSPESLGLLVKRAKCYPGPRKSGLI